MSKQVAFQGKNWLLLPAGANRYDVLTLTNGGYQSAAANANILMSTIIPDLVQHQYQQFAWSGTFNGPVASIGRNTTTDVAQSGTSTGNTRRRSTGRNVRVTRVRRDAVTAGGQASNNSSSI